MNLVTEKMLAAYFESPPLTDYLSLPHNGDPGTLGCLIAEGPMQRAAWAMITAERKAADRARQSQTSRQRADDAIGINERFLNPAPRVLPTVAPKPAERREPPPRRNARRFDPAEFRGDPLLALTKADRDAKINAYRYAAKVMCQEADWDENLAIAGPKIIDQLLYMCERLVHSVTLKQAEVAAQLKALARQTMGDEIPLQQIERCERQLQGLRVQQRHFELMNYAFQQERDPVVSASGLDWGRYEGIKQRSERSAQAYRSKVHRRSSLAAVIENMSDAEYGRWVENTKRYEPRLNGVAASDEEARDDMRGILPRND
jgi:hypothetical protein